MSGIYAIIGLCAFATVISADEKLMIGGLSPDKRLGAYMIGENYTKGKVNEDPSIEIRRERDQKVLGSIGASGYTQYFSTAYSDTKVAWSGDSKFCGFLCRDIKTTRTPAICAVNKDALKEVNLPNYISAIGKRIKGFGHGRYFWAEEMFWEGHDLKVRISGNMTDNLSDPENAPDDWYECTVIFHVESSEKASLRDVIINKQPKEREKTPSQ